MFYINIFFSDCVAPEATGRPKSAVLTAIEKRMRALEAEHARQHGTDDVDDALDEESQCESLNLHYRR